MQFLEMKLSNESVYKCARATYSKGGQSRLTGSDRCFAEPAVRNTSYRFFWLTLRLWRDKLGHGGLLQFKVELKYPNQINTSMSRPGVL